MEFFIHVDNDTRNIYLNFGGNSDPSLDLGVLNDFFTIALMSHIGGIGLREGLFSPSVFSSCLIISLIWPLNC